MDFVARDCGDDEDDNDNGDDDDDTTAEPANFRVGAVMHIAHPCVEGVDVSVSVVFLL